MRRNRYGENFVVAHTRKINFAMRAKSLLESCVYESFLDGNEGSPDRSLLDSKLSGNRYHLEIKIARPRVAGAVVLESIPERCWQSQRAIVFALRSAYLRRDKLKFATSSPPSWLVPNSSAALPEEANGGPIFGLLARVLPKMVRCKLNHTMNLEKKVQSLDLSGSRSEEHTSELQ